MPAITPMSWLIRADGGLLLGLQGAHDFQDLRLHRHVQRGGRLVGDQQIGPQIVAIAIITRWRMPPDNSCGYCFMRRALSGMRT